ncbi:F0F1 ATP synthase subunit gamma [Cryptosporangium arvum]|uniref:F0F1 ATP synthase subunit gamma n=1 Tax=Cryptosporangium arvum TaxID=80871 RepID=UPI0004B989E5|nr:F0F1 ATP synthase subunit gamma [Cryptosporangium arvum]
MPASLRVLRRRIKSVQQTKKITKAQELIATSRIAKARARVEASRPYAEAITRVLTALATNSSSIDHPLLNARERVKRVGILLITSDRGLAGGYNANVIRRAEQLIAQVQSDGQEPVLYVIGRKGAAYFRFRNRHIERSWTGFSESPDYDDAKEVGEFLVQTFLAGADDTLDGPGLDGVHGVDELHLVSTDLVSMITQRPVAHRFAPMDVSEEAHPEGPRPIYEFEPEPEQLLSALLPKYLNTRIYAALLESAASESASRRQAMKSASDNAGELVKSLSREANAARQAQITQEISEIVGGSNALATAGSDD